MDKPKIKTPAQIEHLKRKGVKFTIDSESKALAYLADNNNFFKLTAYRKNFTKNRDDMYVNLEFAHLRDLAIMDMRIRKCLLDMCLDVEHSARVRIVKAIEDSPEDGYAVVADFKAANEASVADTYLKAKNSPYCRDLIEKYRDSMPIWAFVEIQQFGSLCKLYLFVAKRLDDRNMKNEHYMLQEIRHIRNACAHSNCILNDLKSQDKPAYQTNHEVARAISSAGISRAARARKLSNDRIRQIATLLYFYKQYVKSKGLQKYQGRQLREAFVRRPAEHAEYYTCAEQVLSFFDFFGKLIDNWFPESYNVFTVKKS